MWKLLAMDSEVTAGEGAERETHRAELLRTPAFKSSAKRSSEKVIEHQVMINKRGGCPGNQTKREAFGSQI